MLEIVSQFIPDETIREIRERCGIVEVVSDYVSLKKVGVNHKGLCPFHSEKTPSFFVNEARKFFHCFGCGASGDVFAFLMKLERLSFQESVRVIAKKCGISIPEKKLSPRDRDRLSEQARYLRINELMARHYHELLLHDKRAERARQYLEHRGLSPETIREHWLGFAPDEWDTAVSFVGSQGISLAEAGRLGLIIEKGSGRYYDRFRNRIMFPILNVARHVIGFGGRVIDAGEPKYLNSPESPLFRKGHSLYGLHAAHTHIQQQAVAIVVEGYLDALSLQQAGIKNAVAALGTALTDHQISLLRRYTANIIMVFDGDPSGEKAMVRSLEPFLKQGLAPRMILLPRGDDPDSFVRRQGAEAFTLKIATADYLADFVVERIIQRHNIATPQGKVAACDELIPLLEQLSDALVRDLYIQKVARRINIEEERLRSRMEAARKAQPQVRPSVATKHPREDAAAATLAAEKMIIQLMLSSPQAIDVVSKASILEEFSDEGLRGLAILLDTVYRQHGELNLPLLMEAITRQDWRQRVMESCFAEALTGDALKMLEDCIRDIRLKKNSQQLEAVNNLLKQAEASHDTTLSHRYMLEHQDLLRQKKGILQFKLSAYQI
jgi:DNA primase